MGIIPVVMVVAAVAVACRDELAGERALGVLDPVVRAVSTLAADLLQRPLTTVSWLAAILAGALVVVAVWPGRGGWPRWLVLAAAAAVLGQLALLLRLPLAGAAGYVIAVALVAVDRWRVRRRSADDILAAPAGPVTVAELAVLCVLLAAALMLRLYALNRIPDVFEGELSPYMVGAASWRGVLLANAGVEGPWAPLGWLYYLPIRLGIALVGPTVMGVRLGSALVAVATLALAWLVAREAAGRWAGLAASALLVLDPVQIGWARSDVHPHGATAWPGLLLCWLMMRLHQRPRWPLAAAAALVMGLAWHQYPSGQLVVALPLLCVGGWWLGDREFRREFRWAALWLVAGLGLWLAGGPLATWAATGRVEGLGGYLARLGPRVEGGGPEGVLVLARLAVHAAGNALDLAAGLFTAVPHLFHQTPIPALPGLPVRSLPWLTVALAVVGVALLAMSWRSSASLPLLALVGCGAAPAVLADIAYVKRAAVMYPALVIIAGIAWAVIVAETAPSQWRWWRWSRRAAVGLLLLAVVGGWFGVEVRLWLSGDRYRAGRPDEETVAAAVAGLLEPGTMAVGVFTDHYLIGKLTFLLLDDLHGPGPLAWVPVYAEEGVPARLVTAPQTVADSVAQRSWTHRWTDLGRRWGAVREAARWRRVVYLIQRAPQTEPLVAQIEARCGHGWRRFKVGPQPWTLDLMACRLPAARSEE